VVVIERLWANKFDKLAIPSHSSRPLKQSPE
jgi:hypothetical protein